MTSSPSRGALRDTGVVLGTFVLLGVVCGVAWWLLVDLPEFSRGRGGGSSMGEVELGKRFNADGWYTVLALVVGFLAGGALTWWRSRDYLLTTVLLVPGAGIAAATTAVVGGALGPSDSRSGVELVQPGEPVTVALALGSDVAYLMWPIAALAGALMVLWSGTRDPRGRPEPSDRSDVQQRPDEGAAEVGTR